MTVAFFPTMIALGLIVGLMASATTFAIMRNLKATVLMFIAVFAFAAIFTTLIVLQSSIAWQ